MTSNRRRMLHASLHVMLGLLSLVYVVPFLWMVSTSLKLTGREITFPPQWIPNPVVWNNYVRAMTVVPMVQFLQNTLVVTVTATVCGVLTASLAGYAFARLRFPGRDKLFAMCLTALMLPLARPVLATLAILSVIYHWNEFLRPLVYIHTPTLRTLAIGLALFKSEYLVEWNLMMAASTLMLLPILVLFFLAQRYFVQGIVMTGIKG